jgi:hypothetical protein
MAPYGVSANRLHGFGRFNLQNTSRPGGAMRRGLPDHLGRLEEEGWRKGKAEGLSCFQINDEIVLGG